MADQVNAQDFYQPQLYSQQPQIDRYASVIKDLTDPSYLIPLMESDLRRIREVKNPASGKWELENIGVPLLNEEGIANVMSLARVTINNISVLNELPKELIVALMESLYQQLIRDLMINRKTYGIAASNDRNLVVSIVLTPIWLTLNRSRDGGERDFFNKRPGLSEPSQGGGGFWNIFKRGKA